MPPRRSSNARVLAPAALAVCAVLFIFVLATSGGGGGDGDRENAGGAQAPSTESARPSRRRSGRARGSTYTVKTGDTLGSISEKTGVGIEQLQQLNPQLDPQGLVSGQKLKTRE